MCVILQEVLLDFYPGPIHAVDGDRGLSSPLSYSIISGTIHTNSNSYFKKCVVLLSITVFVFMLGDDDGRFLMDTETGEVKLIGVVGDRLTTPELHLHIMVRHTHSVFTAGLKDIHSYQSHWSVFCLSVCFAPRHIRTTTPGSCFSVGLSSGSEPVLSRVYYGWTSRLCNYWKELCLSGQYLWQQGTDVIYTRSSLWPCKHYTTIPHT